MFDLPYQSRTPTAYLRHSVARTPARFDARTSGLALKFVLRGCEEYAFGQRELRLGPGEFLLVRPEVAFRATAGNERTEGVCVDLYDVSPTDIPELLYDVPLPVTSAGLTLPQPVAFQTTRDNFLHACRRELSTLCQLIIDVDARVASTGKKLVTRQAHLRCLLAVRAYLRHYPDRRPTLSELARIAGLSAYHLQRLFTRAFGESPLAMGRRLRLERARVLLCDTSVPLGHIAVDLGYSTPAVFSREFRTAYGLSPRRWRAERN